MALTNLNNNHLTPEDLTAALDSLALLENALASMNTSLTADDR